MRRAHALKASCVYRNNSVTGTVCQVCPLGLCTIYVVLYLYLMTVSLYMCLFPSVLILFFPFSHPHPLAARRLPQLVKAICNEPQGGQHICLHAASVSSDKHQDESLWPHRTMTGCRCPKLAGRRSNFKEHFVSKHASHFKRTALTRLEDVKWEPCSCLLRRNTQLNNYFVCKCYKFWHVSSLIQILILKLAKKFIQQSFFVGFTYRSDPYKYTSLHLKGHWF